VKKIIKKVKYIIEEMYHDEKKKITESNEKLQENRQTRQSAYNPLK